MMANRILYDLEEDILTLSKKRKVKRSIDIGDFIIDIDMDGSVSGVEIHDATMNLDVDKRYLEKLDEVSMSVTYKPGYVYIFLSLQIDGKEKDVSIPITVNLGHDSFKKEKVNFALA